MKTTPLQAQYLILPYRSTREECNDPLINDGQKLIGARTRSNSPICFYDDGQGPLFAHRNSAGIDAIIRAQSWEDACSIWGEEFAAEPDPEDVTEEALIKDRNGDALDKLTPGALDRYEIRIFVREFDDEEIALVPSLPLLA